MKKRLYFKYDRFILKYMMNKPWKYLVGFWSVIFPLLMGMGQEIESLENPQIVGFVDENRDGINDRFVDRDGNGINDVTGQPYSHTFTFQDENNDNVNDLWTDGDGDGVNDYYAEIEKKLIKWVDADGDGILDKESVKLQGKDLKAQVLDTNQDDRNDITGEEITDTDIKGYRFGCVYEEVGIRTQNYQDSNGDGMHDQFQQFLLDRQSKQGPIDYFLDIDGDGVSDDRGLGRLLGREKSRGKGQEKGRGNR